MQLSRTEVLCFICFLLFQDEVALCPPKIVNVYWLFFDGHHVGHHVGHLVGHLVYLHVGHHVQLHVDQLLFFIGHLVHLHVGHHVHLYVGHHVSHHNLVSKLCKVSETLTE